MLLSSFLAVINTVSPTSFILTLYPKKEFDSIELEGGINLFSRVHVPLIASVSPPLSMRPEREYTYTAPALVYVVPYAVTVVLYAPIASVVPSCENDNPSPK